MIRGGNKVGRRCFNIFCFFLNLLFILMFRRINRYLNCLAFLGLIWNRFNRLRLRRMDLASLVKLNKPLFIRPYIFCRLWCRRFFYIAIMGALAFIILSKGIVPFISRRFFVTGLVAIKRIKKVKSVISLRYSLIKSEAGVSMDSLIKQK